MARLAGRDIRSTVGSNLAVLARHTVRDPWAASHGQLKAALLIRNKVEDPEVETWRLPYLKRLLGERRDAYYLGEVEETARLQGLIDSLCIN